MESLPGEEETEDREEEEEHCRCPYLRLQLFLEYSGVSQDQHIFQISVAVRLQLVSHLAVLLDLVLLHEQNTLVE